MSYFHGVYNSEIDTSLTAPIQGSAGLQVIFGTAPIHLSRDPAAAVNKPMLCYSFAECSQNVGYSDNFKDFTLCQSIDACFRVFNIAPIILVNVLDPAKAKHTTVNAAEDCPVVDGQVIYTKPYTLLDTLEIKDGETVLERDMDYIAQHDNDGNVLITILSQAAQEAATLSVAG